MQLQADAGGGGWGVVVVRGRFDCRTLMLGWRSYIMESLNFPDEEVSSCISPS